MHVEKGGDSTNNTEKLVLAFGIFLFFTAIFVNVSTIMQAVDVSTVPTVVQPLISAAKSFFVLGPVVFLIGYLRNQSGYFRNWFQQHADQTVQFELKRFGNTFIYYGAIINGFVAGLASFVPGQYSQIFSGTVLVVGMMVDLGTAEFKKLSGEATTPTTQPATPAMPPDQNLGTYQGWTVKIQNCYLEVRPPADLTVKLGAVMGIGSVAGYPADTDFMAIAKGFIDNQMAIVNSPSYASQKTPIP